eukprot:g501.t1
MHMSEDSDDSATAKRDVLDHRLDTLRTHIKEKVHSPTSIRKLNLSRTSPIKRGGNGFGGSRTSSKVLRRIHGLNKFVNLRELDVSGNSIVRIEGVGHLTYLTHLNLADNRITMISGIWSLLNLKTLNISGNRIETIPRRFRALQMLETLRLDRNAIRRIEEIDSLAPMRRLRHLSLVGNPVTRERTYSASFVRSRLRSLLTLDAKTVLPSSSSSTDTIAAPRNKFEGDSLDSKKNGDDYEDGDDGNDDANGDRDALRSPWQALSAVMTDASALSTPSKRAIQLRAELEEAKNEIRACREETRAAKMARMSVVHETQSSLERLASSERLRLEKLTTVAEADETLAMNEIRSRALEDRVREERASLERYAAEVNNLRRNREALSSLDIMERELERQSEATTKLCETRARIERENEELRDETQRNDEAYRASEVLLAQARKEHESAVALLVEREECERFAAMRRRTSEEAERVTLHTETLKKNLAEARENLEETQRTLATKVAELARESESLIRVRDTCAAFDDLASLRSTMRSERTKFSKLNENIALRRSELVRLTKQVDVATRESESRAAALEVLSARHTTALDALSEAKLRWKVSRDTNEMESERARSIECENAASVLRLEETRAQLATAEAKCRNASALLKTQECALNDVKAECETTVARHTAAMEDARSRAKASVSEHASVSEIEMLRSKVLTLRASNERLSARVTDVERDSQLNEMRSKHAKAKERWLARRRELREDLKKRKMVDRFQLRRSTNLEREIQALRSSEARLQQVVESREREMRDSRASAARSDGRVVKLEADLVRQWSEATAEHQHLRDRILESEIENQLLVTQTSMLQVDLQRAKSLMREKSVEIPTNFFTRIPVTDRDDDAGDRAVVNIPVPSSSTTPTHTKVHMNRRGSLNVEISPVTEQYDELLAPPMFADSSSLDACDTENCEEEHGDEYPAEESGSTIDDIRKRLKERLQLRVGE